MNGCQSCRRLRINEIYNIVPWEREKGRKHRDQLIKKITLCCTAIAITLYHSLHQENARKMRPGGHGKPGQLAEKGSQDLKPDRLNGPATDIPHVCHVNDSRLHAEDIRQLLGATLDEPLPRRILIATHMHIVGARDDKWGVLDRAAAYTQNSGSRGKVYRCSSWTVNPVISGLRFSGFLSWPSLVDRRNVHRSDYESYRISFC